MERKMGREEVERVLAATAEAIRLAAGAAAEVRLTVERCRATWRELQGEGKPRRHSARPHQRR